MVKLYMQMILSYLHGEVVKLYMQMILSYLHGEVVHANDTLLFVW